MRVQVLLTVDVEAHRVLDEISGTAHDSLAVILSSLAAHDVRSTFFVDVCEIETWGEAVMRRTCDRIVEQGHDVQLHVHPHHSSGDTTRWHLSQYSCDEQAAILGKAIDQYRTLVRASPYAFRAGGFGIDDNCIDFLQRAGLKVDCSYMWGWPGCNIRPNHHGLPSAYRGMTELPMTPIVGLGTRRRPIRIGPLDFNWQPLFVLKDALRSLQASGAPLAVLLLHSSSMYVRVGKRRLWYRRAHESKLRDLLEFLRTEGFETATVRDAAERLPVDTARDGDAIYTAPNVAVQHAILFFQSTIGFGISRKFRAFVLAHVAVVAAAAILVFWMFRR